MSIKGVRLFAVLGAATVLVVGLSACTADAGGVPRRHATTVPGSPSEGDKPTPSPSATVEPVLVIASMDVDGSHVTASGYVQGIIEDGGTCTYTFARSGSSSIAVDHEAVADRATTSCGTVQADVAQFARGAWSVTLGYANGGRQFESAPVEVEVP